MIRKASASRFLSGPLISDISDSSVFLNGEHHIYTSLNTHFLSYFRITEILNDVFLHHFIKTGSFITGSFTTRKNRYVFNHSKRNINIQIIFFNLHIIYFNDLFFLTSFRRFNYRFFNLFLIFYYLNNFRSCRWWWWWWCL